MEKLKLEINNKLEVFYDKKNYKSVIQDIREKEKEVLISIPVFDGEYLTLATGTIIEQIYYGNNNIYQFKTKILGRTKERNLSLYRLSLPYDIKKIQRRDYVRVNFVKIINYINAKDIENEKYKKALLLDLSGGGMRIKVEEKLEKGEVFFQK